MIANTKPAKSIRDPLNYNEKKIETGQALLLDAQFLAGENPTDHQ